MCGGAVPSNASALPSDSARDCHARYKSTTGVQGPEKHQDLCEDRRATDHRRGRQSSASPLSAAGADGSFIPRARRRPKLPSRAARRRTIRRLFPPEGSLGAPIFYLQIHPANTVTFGDTIGSGFGIESVHLAPKKAYTVRYSTGDGSLWLSFGAVLHDREKGDERRQHSKRRNALGRPKGVPVVVQRDRDLQRERDNGGLLGEQRA